MRTIYLLLLVASTAVAESGIRQRRRSKRELLVRTKRRWVLSTIELKEEEPGPYPLEISQMFNTMSGSFTEFRISGMGVDEDPKGVFRIEPNTGTVFALKKIDREKYKRFHIKFDIFDRRTNTPIDKELAFDVEVKDINDNAPTFLDTPVVINVEENSPIGYLPRPLHVTDMDKENTSNSKIHVSVISQNPQEPKINVKQLDGRMVQLTLHGCFDYDKHKKYEVTLLAKDEGQPVLSSTTVVTLNILDSNTHQPVFKERQYQGAVNESATKDNVLRFAVDDKDTPQTPGWRAKYYFIKGNEEGNYKLETDPITNEGILSVIKGKKCQRTTLTNLQIGVKNEQPIFTCKGRSRSDSPEDSVNITMKVIDVNDPPEFKNSPTEIFMREEEEPGKLLFTPDIHDVDSDVDKIKYVLLEDPAGWVTIDEKTGKVTSTKKMDRESPFLNGTNVYKVLVGAIDDGEPVATGTGTVLIHLRDINDNIPELVNKGVIMCGNKVNKVMVPAKDLDIHPFSGPFSFHLGDEDKTLKERWKLEPYTGQEAGLVSLKTLAYGNYSVPLVIQDQQNMVGKDTLEVIVCECGDKDVCLGKKPATASLGPAAIGLLFAGLLLFLLLLLLCICQCKEKLKPMPLDLDEGHQTLIKYNQEGGGSECQAAPTLLLASTTFTDVTDGIKQGNKMSQMSQMAPVMAQNANAYKSAGMNLMNSNMSTMGTYQSETRGHRGQSMYSAWTTNRTNTFQGSSSRYKHSVSLQSNQQHIADHLDRRLYMIDGNHVDHPVYQPYEYADEGQSSKCQSLDELSVSNLGDDLKFLNDLGPKFKTLHDICRHTIKEKNIQL